MLQVSGQLSYLATKQIKFKLRVWLYMPKRQKGNQYPDQEMVICLFEWMVIVVLLILFLFLLVCLFLPTSEGVLCSYTVIEA